MTAFDTLDEVRSVARARSQESFAYFALHVLGAKVTRELCDGVQGKIERGEVVEVDKKLGAMLDAWLVCTGHAERKVLATVRTETLEWLFGAEIAA